MPCDKHNLEYELSRLRIRSVFLLVVFKPDMNHCKFMVRLMDSIFNSNDLRFSDTFCLIMLLICTKEFYFCFDWGLFHNFGQQLGITLAQ